MVLVTYSPFLVGVVALSILAHAVGNPTNELVSTSIIDILSSQAEYSYFLRHLQRAGLVPIINSLENVTVLAPVNLAFAGAQEDFHQESLLRYFVNLPLRVANLYRSHAIFDTLYRLLPTSNYTLAIGPDLNSEEYLIDGVSTAIGADTFAKHQRSFIQPIDQLLPIKPSLCQWLQSDSILYRHPNISWTLQLIGLIIKTRISTPVVGKHLSCAELLENTRSLFIPTDAFVDQNLLPLQSKYYTSLYRYMNCTTYDTTKSALNEFHADVLALVSGLRESLLVFGTNGTSEKLKARYSIDSGTNNLVINHSLYVNQSIAFADGVVHILDTQIQEHANPFGVLGAPIIEMNSRKALNALHYTNFVSEMYFRNLGYLIDGSTQNQTIFVEVEERDDKSDDEGRILAFSNRQNLLYHFADIALPYLNDRIESKHQLVESKLCSRRRIGGCFRLKISQSSRKGNLLTTINDDAMVESGPIYAGNDTYIYFTDAELPAPSSFKRALGDLISSGGVPRHVEDIVIDQDSCLMTIKLLSQFDLLSLDNNGKGYTAFLPCGVGAKTAASNNWENLGLIFTYLTQNPQIFKKVLKGLIVEGTVYSDFGIDDSKQSISPRNLNGDRLQIQHQQLGLKDQNFVTLNSTEVSLPLNSDVLFAQGVLHVVDEVLLFDDLVITFSDLLETTVDKKQSEESFMSIINLIPQFRARLGLDHANGSLDLSILIPTTESLIDQNITASFAQINDFFDFHTLNGLEAAQLARCVDGPRIPDRANTSTIIKTNLHNESLTCIHDSHSRKTWLRLVLHPHLSGNPSGLSLYNKDHEIELLSYGCSRNVGADDVHPQCVFLIKKPLNLAWLAHSGGGDFLNIHLGFLSIGVGIIFGLGVVGFLVAFVVYCSLHREGSRNIPKRIPAFEPGPRSDFMSVMLEEDEGNIDDYGYETDIEGTRRERAALLSGYGVRKSSRKYGYGATNSARRSQEPEAIRQYPEFAEGVPSPIIKIDLPVDNAVSTPRYIEGANLTKGLARDRNLPGF